MAHFRFFAEDISIYITHCVICRLINLFNITEKFLIVLMGVDLYETTVMTSPITFLQSTDQ